MCSKKCLPVHAWSRGVLPCGIVWSCKCVGVGCAEVIGRRLRRSSDGSVHDGRLRAVKGGYEGLDDQRTKRPGMDHGHLAFGHKEDTRTRGL